MIHEPALGKDTMKIGTLLRISLGTAGVLACARAASDQPDRFPQLKLDDLSGDQRALAERMLKETRSGLRGPWNIMLRSPGMSEGLMSLYNYFRWKTALPHPLMELAILTTAREWSAQFEWFSHYPIAIAAGVPPELLASLRMGKRPENMKPEEAVTHDFTIELCRKHTVSDATFQKAKTLLGEKNVVDLTSVVGTYIAIGALLNVGEVKTTAAQDGPDYLPAIER
jgi:4-carboxymuconolactone decarboxylase